MKTVLRIVLGLGGLLLLFMGIGFLLDPVGSGADFGISVDGVHAITSIRADMTAFFTVGGACFIWGAVARRPHQLLIGAAHMLVTLAARVVSLMVNGSFDGFLLPMAVEAVLGVLALVGTKVLPDQR